MRITNYLFAEVLQRQPEPVRQLLLRTSILERVNGPLADRLLGTTGSERILLELEDASAFVVSIDRGAVLVPLPQPIHRSSSPGAPAHGAGFLPELHHAAAEWHAEHGFVIDAIKHAQAATDWRFAGELIGQYGFSLALDGSFATMRALLEPFPADALANPELAAFLAYGEVIRPSLDTAASYIAVAERHASEVPEERRRIFAAMLATARLTLARWRGDYGTLVSEVRPLLEAVEAETVSEVAAANDVRAVALLNLGTVELWSGAGDDAERHLKEGLELARRNGRPYVEKGCLAHLAVAAGRHSLRRRGSSQRRPSKSWRSTGGCPSRSPQWCWRRWGRSMSWQGRFDDAQPWLDRAEQALRPNAEPAKELFVRYSRGIQRLGEGRLAEAVALFAEAQRLQSLMVAPDPLAISARGLQAQTLVRLGDMAAARAALATASGAEREYGETRVALAAICLAERDAHGAIDVLAPVLAGTAPTILDFSVIDALVIDALARDMLGDSRAAEDDVERALDLAEPDALILPFLITPARDLLERHPRHRTAHAALLANILDVLSGSSLPARSSEQPELAEELTESEIRVLRYLPSNLSAPEIAAEIFLSTSTVKTHMRHIYEKLGAHRRTEAVERARERGLLGPSARSRR